MCDIVTDLDLHSESDIVKELIISKKLTNDQKISLLKIKLDSIINGGCSGMSRFLVLTIIGGMLCFTISGVGGLALILEALYRLFQEGKISKALYELIKKALLKGTPINM